MSKEFEKNIERQEIITPEHFSEECLILFEQRFNRWHRFSRDRIERLRGVPEIPGILRPVFNQEDKLCSLVLFLEDPFALEDNWTQGGVWTRVHSDIDKDFDIIMRKLVGTGEVYRMNNFGFRHPYYFDQQTPKWLNADVSPTRKYANIYNWRKSLSDGERVNKLLLSIRENVNNFQDRYKIGQIRDAEGVPYQTD